MAAESFMKQLRRITWKTGPRTAALFGWSVLCSDNVDSHSVCRSPRSAQGQTGLLGASARRWRLLCMQATQGLGSSKHKLDSEGFIPRAHRHRATYGLNGTAQSLRSLMLLLSHSLAVSVTRSFLFFPLMGDSRCPPLPPPHFWTEPGLMRKVIVALCRQFCVGRGR